MALYFEESLGIPISVVGIIFTLLSVGSIFFSLVGGGLADYIGRRNTLILGAGISFLLFSSLSFIIQDRSLVVPVVILFILTSIGGAFVFPSASALVSDVTDEKERVNGFVVYRILSNLGWAVGPLTGSLIIVYGIHWIFILVSACSIMQGIIVAIFIRGRNRPAGSQITKEKRKFGLMAFDRLLLLFSFGTFFLTMVASQFSVTLPLYAGIFMNIPSSSIGYIYAVNGALVVIGQYPITNALKRFSDMVPMVLGTVFYSLGYLSVAFAGNLYGLMVSMAIITVGENMTSPVMNSVVSKIAPEDKVARFMGFLGMINSTGRALGPSIGAFLISAFLKDGVFVWLTVDVFGAMAVMIFLIFSGYSSRHGKQNQKGGPAGL